jgi:hypothetical protein
MTKLVLLLCLMAGGATMTMGATQNSNQQTPAPASPAAGAPQTSPAPLPSAPPASPGDADSIEHIITAVYDVISGPAGAPRDWDRFRSLFYPGARLIPTRRDDKGVVTAVVLSPDEYVTRGKNAFANQGFFENSISNRIESWDHIAHVWSAYESRHAKGEKPFARGINSFQLFNDGTRWWILSIFWEGEDKDHPLPEKYVKRG